MFRRKNSGRSNRQPARLTIEGLEARQMMAGDGVEAFVQQGTLYIYGTQESDQIEVRFADGQIEVPGATLKNAQGQVVDKLSREEVPYLVIATGQAGDDLIQIVEDGDRALPVVFFGNTGDDTLIGGSQADVLVGQDGRDFLCGNEGDDKLIAALYADDRDPAQPEIEPEYLEGGEGHDTLYGSGGRDSLFGNAGDDLLYGLGGDDLLVGDAGTNTYDGGDGGDQIAEGQLYGAVAADNHLNVARRVEGASVSTDSPVVSVEKIRLEAAADAVAVVFDASGLTGDATLVGSAGGDLLAGGAGNDLILGLAGNDVLQPNGGTANVVNGGADRDRLVAIMALRPNIQLTDAVFSELGSSSSELSSIEEAMLEEHPRAILATPVPRFASRYSLFGNRRLKGPTIINDTPSPPVSIDASAFSGKIQIFSRDVEKTATYFDRGQLHANPNSADWAVSVKHKALGGAVGYLGAPVSAEMTAADGFGRVRHYQNGSIYWSPATGAHAVSGTIRAKWAALGSDLGALGYPTSDEYNGAVGVQMMNFQNGKVETRDGVAQLSFDRNEMIRYLTRLGEDGISGDDLWHMWNLVRDVNVSMPDHVRYLASKVAFGYEPTLGFGNPLSFLIDKYFLGGVRPDVGGYRYDVTYQYAAAPLWGATGNPQLSDVKQGELGDCYFLAALQAVGAQSPQSIKDMFIDNGDGTFTVRFFQDGRPHYVTVDRYLPTKDGKLVFAGEGQSATSPAAGDTLWAALAEKAFAQLNEQDWVGGDGLYAYQGENVKESGIVGGKAVVAMQMITGRNSHFAAVSGDDWYEEFVHDISQGRWVVLHSNQQSSDIHDPRLVQKHVWVVWAISSDGRTIHAFNPWGHDNQRDAAGNYGPASSDLTEQQIFDNFRGWSWIE